MYNTSSTAVTTSAPTCQCRTCHTSFRAATVFLYQLFLPHPACHLSLAQLPRAAMATTSQGAASLAEVQSPSQLSSSFWSPSSLSSPSYPPSSCSSSLTAATHSVATFPSPSLCPESEAEQQLLVSAGLWSHYLHSISALTHAFRHWTQRTLASYKQLSQSTPIDSADLNATLAKLQPPLRRCTQRHTRTLHHSRSRQHQPTRTCTAYTATHTPIH